GRGVHPDPSAASPLSGLSVQTLGAADSSLFNRVDASPEQQPRSIALNGAVLSAVNLGGALDPGKVMRIIGPQSVLDGLGNGSLELVHSGGGNLGVVREAGSNGWGGHLRFGDPESAGTAPALAAFQ